MPPPHALLQCGYPSSGNYLLFRILSALQRANGAWFSLREASGFGAWMRAHLDPSLLAFPEEPDIDIVRDGQVQTTTGRFPGDLALVRAHATLIWTHDRPAQAEALAPAGERLCVYVVRDGRDAITAQLHRLTSERERRLHPSYRIADPLELARRPGTFESLVAAWRDHAAEILGRPGWIVVRYEDLCRAKEREIGRLARELDLPLTDACMERLLSETSPAKARAHASSHVRRAAPAGHRALFEPWMEAEFERLAGEVQAALGYADEPADASLPSR